MTGLSLCSFCVEEHRGACAHPQCPVAFTGGLDDALAPARPAPTPTRPSVAGEPARAVAPSHTRARRGPQIATQPSVAQAGPPEREEARP